MKEEKIIVPANGYLMLLVFFVLFIGSIVLISVFKLFWLVVVTILSLVLSAGFIMVQPNGSRVLVLFGDYIGTVKKNGFFWVNPFYSKQKI